MSKMYFERSGVPFAGEPMTAAKLREWIEKKSEGSWGHPENPWWHLARKLEHGWEVRITKRGGFLPIVEFVRVNYVHEAGCVRKEYVE